MEYENKTKNDVIVPVHNDCPPSSHIKVKVGEIKDIPDRAIEAAELLGLTKAEVKAEVSSVGETEVETKQIASSEDGS